MVLEPGSRAPGPRVGWALGGVAVVAAFGAAAACGHDKTPAEAHPDGTPVPGDATFSWTAAAPCPVARFEAVGAVVEGELWVMGGFVSSSLDVTRRVDIYSPGTDGWRRGPDLPGAETHLGVAAADGDLIVAGGFEGNGRAWKTVAEVWRWRGADGVWASGPPLPSARAAGAAALVGSELHLAGGLSTDGNSDTGDHVVWNLPAAPTWLSAAPLPEPRNHGGGAATSGVFLAIAGRRGWDEVAGDLTSVHAFDPATGAWAARAPIPIERSEIGASTFAMSDGRVLVVGGSIAGIHPSASVYVYDPLLDGWSRLPSLPGARKGAVAARIGAQVIVTTGSPTSTDPDPTTFVGCCL